MTNNANGATIATYGYDLNDNLATRTLNNATSTSLSYDPLDRVTHISHVLGTDTRTFDYGYNSVGNRKWAEREGNMGDRFAERTGSRLNI